MTAVLYDEVVTATPTPKLRVVTTPQPTAAPTRKVSRRPDRQFGGDPLVAGAARLLCVPLRQVYAALWRVGLLEVGA
ncbi:Rv1535 family protein [Mycobacterium sp.]|uniref:Rv1535 family protein n=1 Tax=Mycobacterium sp. TaxID=1785 RepID=UPI003D6C4662